MVFHEMCTKTERATWFLDNVSSPSGEWFLRENKKINDKQLKFKGHPVANMTAILLGAANTFFIHAFQMEYMYGVNPFDKAEIEKHADIVIDLIYTRRQD